VSALVPPGNRAPGGPVPGRLLVAGVWGYQGLWRKVLRGSRHRAIVAAAPGLPAGWAGPATVAIGLAETAVAGWVLAGRRPRAVAVVQTVGLVGMNAGGLAFAGERIAAPGRMLARNAAFLALIWHAAGPASTTRPGRGRRPVPAEPA
jgi:hypothetical protein